MKHLLLLVIVGLLILGCQDADRTATTARVPPTLPGEDEQEDFSPLAPTEAQRYLEDGLAAFKLGRHEEVGNDIDRGVAALKTELGDLEEVHLVELKPAFEHLEAAGKQLAGKDIADSTELEAAINQIYLEVAAKFISEMEDVKDFEVVPASYSDDLTGAITYLAGVESHLTDFRKTQVREMIGVGQRLLKKMAAGEEIPALAIERQREEMRNFLSE